MVSWQSDKIANNNLKLHQIPPSSLFHILRSTFVIHPSAAKLRNGLPMLACVCEGIWVGACYPVCLLKTHLFQTLLLCHFSAVFFVECYINALYYYFLLLLVRQLFLQIMPVWCMIFHLYLLQTSSRPGLQNQLSPCELRLGTDPKITCIQ